LPAERKFYHETSPGPASYFEKQADFQVKDSLQKKLAIEPIISYHTALFFNLCPKGIPQERFGC